MVVLLRICAILLVINIGLSSSAFRNGEGTISECAAKGGECDESKGRPVCGTDNQTYPTRCHLIRAQCSGHQVSIKHRGACKNECMASRQYALSHRSTTKFIPRCRADGSYAAIQCLLENHNCWCVTSDGKPIPNTASQNARPNCQRSSKNNARRSPLRLAAKKRGCSPADKNQFNTNLLKMFNNEYLRQAKHTGGASEKKVLDWKFAALDKNTNNILDKNEFRELKRLVKGVVKPKRCSRAFGRFCDLDTDERLTKQEWSNCFNKEPINHESNGVALNSPGNRFGNPNNAPVPIPAGSGNGGGQGQMPGGGGVGSMPQHHRTGLGPGILHSDNDRGHFHLEEGEDNDQSLEEGEEYDDELEEDPDDLLDKREKLLDSDVIPYHKKPGFLLQGKTTLDLNADHDNLNRDGNDGESDCIADRNAALEEQKNGEVAMYVPECTADGRYHRVQCYRSTGYCWCVHEDTGKNIPGTSTKDKKPQCDSVYSSSRPMKGCPEGRKVEFLRDLKVFLKHQFIAANGNTGLNNTNGWGTDDERIGTLSFVILDKNKNKVWERREWKTFREMVTPIKQLRKCGKKLPKYCDQNNDREITLAEWLNCLESQRVSSSQGSSSAASPSILSQTTAETNADAQQRPVQSKFKGPNPLDSYLKSD